MLSRKLTGALGAGIFAIGVAASAAPAQAAIFTVINTNNGGPGSLRAAITSANMQANRDQILFAIPGNAPHVISLAVDLPPVTRPVSIRGYSQPDASAATPTSAADPTVVIDATNAVRGLHVSGQDVEVRGLVINRAQVDGIWVTGDRAIVAGNYLGTNAAGDTGVANAQYGVHIDGDDIDVGGPDPEDRNVIAGNLVGGVHLHTGTGNVVEGNYLGIAESGTAGIGGGAVQADSSQSTVKDNVISFN